MSALPSIVIMISGRGSNMSALVQACIEGKIRANVVKVISDKTDAAGLVAAQSVGINTAAFERRVYPSKQAHEAAILNEIKQTPPELICLAGFMRILSSQFVSQYEGRIVNIHPSLLPKYRGLNTHARALEAGDTQHGCSIHYVTPELDEGPVIAQARVAVSSNDSEQSLAAKVLKLEHPLYIEAVAKLLNPKFS